MLSVPIPAETLSVFFAASLALAFAPGPDNLFVVTQSALNGRLAGLLVTIGLCTGLLVHTAAVAIGLAALFATSAAAYNLLKVAGAAYLVYLAWQALRAGASKNFDAQGSGLSRRDLYLRGVVMNITNPKVAIFFMAFLPQFADPELGSLKLQLTLLGVVFIFAALFSFSIIAWLSGHLGSWMRRSDRAQSILNRIAALVFVTLAARLLVSER